jgi:hypothetical protein
MVDVSGRHDRLVVTLDYRRLPRDQFYCPPQWAPDGRRLATLRIDHVYGPEEANRLVTFTPAGTNERVEFTIPKKGPEAGVMMVACEFSWQAR